MLQYFGAGDECHMAFHFPLMPRIYMAVATEDRHPVTDIMRQTPEIPQTCQWAVFLRNHDELTLEMVTDRERDYLWDHYAGDRRARINLGIRRRLAPLMDNDRRKIELLKGLLLSLPGTPVLYYGDEIGMGDNVYLGDRDGVRTPMQWSFDRNGGFSRTDAAQLYLPPIMDPVYGFESVNVEAQSRSPSSLLNWTKRLIAARRTHRAMGRGTLRFLYPANRKVIAYLREWEGETILCVANLSRSAQALELDLAEFRGRQVVEVLGRSVFPQIGEQPYLLTLQGYSFFWFELTAPSQADSDGRLAAAAPELVTLVMPQGWADLFSRHNLPLVEGEVIPGFLPRQRWFAAKDQRVEAARVIAHGEIAGPTPNTGDARPDSFLIQIVEVQSADPAAGPAAAGERQMAVTPYFLPLAAVWSPSGSDLRQALAPVTLAELRQFRREGALVDALSQDGFVLALAQAIEHEATLPLSVGEGPAPEIRFRHTPLFREPQRRSVSWCAGSAPNSRTARSSSKITRCSRFTGGPRRACIPKLRWPAFWSSVPVSATRRRSSPRLSWPLAPPEAAGGEPGAPPSSQASASACCSGLCAIRAMAGPWRSTTCCAISTTRSTSRHPARRRRAAPRICPTPIISFSRSPASSGCARRSCTGRSPSTPATIRRLRPSRSPARIWPSGGAISKKRRPGHAGPARSRPRRDGRGLPRPRRCGARRAQPAVRLHPHPGARRDRRGQDPLPRRSSPRPGDRRPERLYFIDFEGEPGRPLAERRRKSSPLRDVAGMIRSFDYAAIAAVRQIAETRPAALPRMAELADAWRERAVDGFRAAYRKAMRGCRAYPVSKLQAKAMIDFFTLEKAVYEVNYELTNRPGWVAIPLNGILRVLAKGSGPTGSGREAHRGAGREFEP